MSPDATDLFTSNPLDLALVVILAAPHSVAHLTLYSLISALELERAGCLFKPTRLRDLDHEIRKIAYQLMELMADGVNQGERSSRQSTKQAIVVNPQRSTCLYKGHLSADGGPATKLSFRRLTIELAGQDKKPSTPFVCRDLHPPTRCP
jgi:hypothetical protein